MSLVIVVSSNERLVKGRELVYTKVIYYSGHKIVCMSLRGA